MDDGVRTVLNNLVQSEGEDFYDDVAQVESALLERAGDHPDEVGALLTAAQAGAVEELRGVDPGLSQIAVGHLVGRMVRLYDADPDAARWAAESWVVAFDQESHAAALAPEGDLRAPVDDRGAPAPVNEDQPPQRRRRISWPWVAVIGAGVVGVIALAVLVRTIVGLLPNGGGGGARGAARSAPTTAPAPPTTVASNGGLLAVPPGLTLGTGDVQVTLLWADGNDLDLHVIDPSGNEIYFANPKSPTGGMLDHDDTAGCATTGTHVENVFWPVGSAPPGRYRVFVENYTSCGAPSRYAVHATAKGQVEISSTATVGALDGDQSAVSEFSIS
ncbi:MAG: hypothetical protein JOZ04_11060 [Acidimicrobiia bacterium]|nr:hypothetical protein [Acidimicrobiia bacterium]